jgi:mannose-6-phosphate isomerase-like protein (cupin superfamily)
MSYPAARYLGSDGEVSATYRPVATAPDLVFPNGTRVHYLATGASSRGGFGLYRWEMGPEPGGAGPHFHRTISESFFVLFGSVRIFDGERWIDTQPGDFVHVPEGGIHGFRNESGAPASMLLHFAPGAPREGYFEGLARFAVEGRPGEDEMAAFFRNHDNTWL